MHRPQPRSRENSVIGIDIKKQFTNFIQNFRTNPQSIPLQQPKYIGIIRKMLNHDKHLLIIDYKDFISFNCQLADFLFAEFYKYQPIVNDALTQIVRLCERTLEGIVEDIAADGKRDEEKQERYEVGFSGCVNGDQQSSVRDLRCDKLGKLFSFRGTVTRTTEVRPELVQGYFRCKACGLQSKAIRQQFKYTEPKKCIGQNCDKNEWQLNVQRSQISDFQKIRVQQDPTRIPPGAMPRSIDVILRNENTEKGQPGDICKFVGYLCVLPQIASMLKPGEKASISTRNNQVRGQMGEMEGITGIKGIRQLNYRLIFVAVNVIVENNQFRQESQFLEEQLPLNIALGQDQTAHKQKYNQQQVIGKVFSRLTEQQIKLMKQFKQNPNLYEDMANSLFPSVFGHSQIKKAILLQLLGGIHKITGNKIAIRGDINILIVGDPSTAKSQFLKAVNKFVPRSVYTNGKTTSAAGLTATVTKDQTNTVGIQAGALMLADNGVCCIDQFDKMNYSDQTAIHQAMQQQTISIAKAGVYATLNARTSILAAANPVFGRYDKSKSLKNNLNISAPIMSRFDLFFVVCDQTNDHSDANLSQFIVNMHINKQKSFNIKYPTKSLKLYISTAKKLKPILTKKSASLLRHYYSQLRLRDKSSMVQSNSSYRVTVRQLESMIRISQALAKLHLDTEVKEDYVKEAYRLITTCIMKLEKSPIVLGQEQEDMEMDVEAVDEIGENKKEKVRKVKAGQNSSIKGDIALQRQLQEKKKQKSHKQVSISYQQYIQTQKSIIQLFKHKSPSHPQQTEIDQQSLVNYILGIKFEAGLIDNEEQSHQMKKIINAIIKKLIREERVLMVVTDSVNIGERVLRLHTNFVP